MITLGKSKNIYVVGPTKDIDGTVVDAASGATCEFRTYDKRKEQAIIVAETRLREDMAASTSVCTIPHITPQWLEAGDTVEIFLDSGIFYPRTVSSVVAGTDDSVPATNFDTVTFTGPIPSAASVGAAIRQTSKSSTSFSVIPIKSHDSPPVLAATDIVEMWLSDPTVDVAFAITDVSKTISTEDGAAAKNQEEHDTMSLFYVSGTKQNSFAGQIFRTRIANAVAMPEYGTVVAGSDLWGFSGVLNPVTAAWVAGALAEIYTILDNGAGLIYIKHWTESVVA